MATTYNLAGPASGTTSAQPSVQIAVNGATVKNNGPSLVYYAATRALAPTTNTTGTQVLSAGSYDGTLAVGASASFDGNQWFTAGVGARAELVVGDPAVVDGIDAASRANRRRLAWNSGTSRAEWRDPESLMLQDFRSGDYRWRSATGITVASGSGTVNGSSTAAFVASDAGSEIMLATDDNRQFRTTIATVDAVSNRVTLADALPVAVTNQRIQWGKRSYDYFTQAGIELLGENDVPKRLIVDGWYRPDTFDLCSGYVGGSGVGSMGPLPTARGSSIAGSIIQQRPGANVDLVRFAEVLFNNTAPSHWMGPIECERLILSGPERNVFDVNGPVTITAGYVIAAKTRADRILGLEDLCYFDKLQIGYGYQGGMLCPQGAGPGMLGSLRFWYNGGYGLDYVGTNHPTQNLMIDYLTGDGNELGLARFSGLDSDAVLDVRGVKSEMGDYFAASNFTAYQNDALIFDDCQGTVHIGPTVHISSVPGGAGTTAPGASVVVRGTHRPKIRFGATPVTRLKGTEIGDTSTAIVLRDEAGGLNLPRGSTATSWPSAAPAALQTYKTLTSAVDNRDYAKIATLTITGQFGRVDAMARITVVDDVVPSANAVLDLMVRLAADDYSATLGTHYDADLRIIDIITPAEIITPRIREDNFKLVITSADSVNYAYTASLYVFLSDSNKRVVIAPLSDNYAGLAQQISWFDSDPLVTALPAGTQVAAKRSYLTPSFATNAKLAIGG